VVNQVQKDLMSVTWPRPRNSRAARARRPGAHETPRMNAAREKQFALFLLAVVLVVNAVALSAELSVGRA